jgi:hypothetical protein
MENEKVYEITYVQEYYTKRDRNRAYWGADWTYRVKTTEYKQRILFYFKNDMLDKYEINK